MQCFVCGWTTNERLLKSGVRLQEITVCIGSTVCSYFNQGFWIKANATRPKGGCR